MDSILCPLPGKSGTNYYDLKKRLNPNFDWVSQVLSSTGDMDIEEVGIISSKISATKFSIQFNDKACLGRCDIVGVLTN